MININLPIASTSTDSLPKTRIRTVLQPKLLPDKPQYLKRHQISDYEKHLNAIQLRIKNLRTTRSMKSLPTPKGLPKKQVSFPRRSLNLIKNQDPKPQIPNIRKPPIFIKPKKIARKRSQNKTSQQVQQPKQEYIQLPNIVELPPQEVICTEESAQIEVQSSVEAKPSRLPIWDYTESDSSREVTPIPPPQLPVFKKKPNLFEEKAKIWDFHQEDL